MVSLSSSSLNESSSSSLSFTEYLFDDMKMEDIICFHFILVAINFLEFFIIREMEKGVGNLVDPKVVV